MSPDEIKCACSYVSQTDNKDDVNFDKIPEWREEYNLGKKYEPSFNIAPTDITPVLVSSAHFEESEDRVPGDRLLVPMMWGMIPPWHKVRILYVYYISILISRPL